jgi:hypothetical protein
MGEGSSDGIPIVTVAVLSTGTEEFIGSGCASAVPVAMDHRKTDARMAAVPAFRRIVATLVIGIATLAITAAPASAHTVSGQSATNYQTRVRSIRPEIPGLDLTVIEAGSRLQLSNRTSKTVIVEGYQSEPYLKLAPDGVYENRRSPTVYLNTVRRNPPPPPPDADASLPPVWRKVSSGHVARWHDHRVHWMGSQDPPIVRRQPDRFHVVNPGWQVIMDVGGRKVTATGDLVWRPGSSPFPWWGLAALLFAGVIAGLLTRPRSTVLIVAVLVLVAADIVHEAGIAFETAKSTASHLAAILTTAPFSVAGWMIAIISLTMLRRRPREALYAAAFAALLIAVVGGFTDLGYLSKSQLPYAWSPALARTAIAITIGLGVGIPAGAVLATLQEAPPLADTSAQGSQP